MVPMMRIERMTSPLPRECSTTEPHGQGSGAGEGNRTLVGGLEGPSSTIELHPLKFEDYIIPPRGTFLLNCCSSIAGGGGWIRTIVGVSQQIYSLPPLATRAPLRSERTELFPISTNLSRPCTKKANNMYIYVYKLGFLCFSPLNIDS